MNEYYQEVGGYAGVVKKRGRWLRYACAHCMHAQGLLGTRLQGPMTKAAAKAYAGPSTWICIKQHN